MPRVVTILLICLSLQPALAVPTTRPATRPAGVVSAKTLADLDSDDFQKREAATHALLADDTLTPEAIADAYRKANSPEQQTRLLDAAFHHFVRGLAEQLTHDPTRPWAQAPAAPGDPMRGSLGVSIQGIDKPGEGDPGPAKTAGARVMRTMPGFPAYVALQPGDVLLGVNGATLTAATGPEAVQEFTKSVTSHAPGEAVSIQFVRDGKVQEVSVALASYPVLSELFDSNQATLTLRPQYDEKWEKFRLTLPGQTPKPVNNVDTEGDFVLPLGR